jgi:hypothetical protein
MSKQRDWIDYVNLGSNIYRNLQLENIDSKLGTLAFTGASEEAKAAEEDHLREFVFEADTHLRGLCAHADKHRVGTLALALVTLGNFERFGVTSAKFRSFPDKEKLRSVIDGFKAFVTECEAMLSAEEKADAQACAQFMLEPDNEAFVPASFTTRLAEAEREVSELDQKKIEATDGPYKEYGEASVALACIGVVVCIIGGTIAVGGEGIAVHPDLEKRGAVIAEIGLALIVLSVIIMCSYWFMNWKAERNSEGIKLVDQVTKLLDLKLDHVRTLKEELEVERQRIKNRRADIIAKVLEQPSDVAPGDTKPLKTNVV